VGLLMPALLCSCSEEPGAGARPEAPAVAVLEEPAPYTDNGPYVLRDVTGESGLGRFQRVSGSSEKHFLVETVGAGCALFDHDQDGDLDAYFTNGGHIGRALEENPPEALFRNDGRARFEDIALSVGLEDRRWTNGVRVCDVDGDGWSDLYLTNYGRNTLYVADGQGAYVDRTLAAGVGVESWSTGAAFFDFDRDGDLDLSVVNYALFDEPRFLAERPTAHYRGLEVLKGPNGLPGAPDSFLVNKGGGVFREAGAELGLADQHLGFQCVAFDFDVDGWLDLFVPNDIGANHLWRNLEGRRFEEVGQRQGVAFNQAGKPQSSMGVAVGDYNGDLRLDLYVTNFTDEYSTLYRGEERGFFLDVTRAVGLSAPTLATLGWGTEFVDFDLDGDQELYAVNGHVYPQVDAFGLGATYHEPTQLFEYDGRRFREPPGRGGVALGERLAARGSATGDVDGDGDIDLLIGNLDGPPRLLRNDGRAGNSLEVVLVGLGQNRAAVGARVVAWVAGKPQLCVAGLAAGFLSSSAPTLVFGLGTREEVERLEVAWPSGKTERFTNLLAGTRVTIEEAPGDAEARASLSQR
jgi:hypothetical protein